MKLSAIFTHRVRGFRAIELTAVFLLVATIMGVYLAKTLAAAERAEIAKAESDIADERERVRLLHAEVAHLESPRRVGRLAEAYLAMKPLPADREISADRLPQIAAAPPPKGPRT